MRHLTFAALMGVVVLAASCGGNPEPVEPAPPPEEPAPTVDADREAEEEARRRAEAEARRRAEEEARRERAVLTDMIFFDFDVAGIRPDQRPVLEAKARVLRENPSVRLRVEGHADDRGSTEYNLALGGARAEAVIDFLTGFGIDPDRFEFRSYGEDRPLVPGGDEESWAQNRRAEFVIVDGSVGPDVGS